MVRYETNTVYALFMVLNFSVELEGKHEKSLQHYTLAKNLEPGVPVSFNMRCYFCCLSHSGCLLSEMNIMIYLVQACSFLFFTILFFLMALSILTDICQSRIVMPEILQLEKPKSSGTVLFSAAVSVYYLFKIVKRNKQIYDIYNNIVLCFFKALALKLVYISTFWHFNIHQLKQKN